MDSLSNYVSYYTKFMKNDPIDPEIIGVKIDGHTNFCSIYIYKKLFEAGVGAISLEPLVQLS